MAKEYFEYDLTEVVCEKNVVLDEGDRHYLFKDVNGNIIAQGHSIGKSNRCVYLDSNTAHVLEVWSLGDADETAERLHAWLNVPGNADKLKVPKKLRDLNEWLNDPANGLQETKGQA